MTNQLPRDAIEADHAFERIHEAGLVNLAAHRWHWTLGLPKASRVTFSEYGRAVGRNYQVISRMANGYDEWLRHRQMVGTNQRQLTLYECIELMHVKAEDRQTLEDYARDHVQSISQARREFRSVSGTTPRFNTKREVEKAEERIEQLVQAAMPRPLPEPRAQAARELAKQTGLAPATPLQEALWTLEAHIGQLRAAVREEWPWEKTHRILQVMRDAIDMAEALIEPLESQS